MRLDLESFRRGTHVVDRETLDAIPVTPRGDRSTRWSGIQHGELANTLVQRVQAADLTVTGETWSVGRNGAHLFGYIELKSNTNQMDLFQATSLDATGLRNGGRPVTAASSLRSPHSGWAAFIPTTARSRFDWW